MLRVLCLLLAAAPAEAQIRAVPGGELEKAALAAGALFDGRRPAASAAPSAGASDQLRRAVAGDEYAIRTLSRADLASATPAQRLAMVKTLMPLVNAPQNGESPDPLQAERAHAVVRVLKSAPNAADFDWVYYRADPASLSHANLDFGEVRSQAQAYRNAVRPGDWAGLDRYIDTVAETKSSGKNLVEFLIDGDGIRGPGLTALEGAKTSIHLEVFQFQADEVGWAVAKLLGEKAKNGVHVRLLLDGNGSAAASDAEVNKLIDFLRGQGAEVIVQRPPLDQGHLDHRKVLVIDGDTAFTGGMNIGQLYQADWHDQQTLVMGPAVAKLQDAFLDKWRSQGGTVPDAERAALYPELKEDPSGSEVRVVAHRGGAKDQNIKAMYLRAIHTAEASIRVANPYFIDADVASALAGAAARGVKVQVVLPQDNDQAIVQRGSRAFYPDLLAAGVEVYEYQGRMAHEKVAVFDSRWATFGSSNLDARSLRYNDELNLAVSDPRLASYIERNLFDADLKSSLRIEHYTPTLRERLDRHLLGELL